MLARFLKRGRQRPAVPPGSRVYAIGDIHGRDDLLDDLLRAIAADGARRRPLPTRLVFLGDYVDRGPGSAAVVARLMALEAGGADAIFLAGNHEEVLLEARASRQAAGLLSRIGGRETLMSYGVEPHAYEAADLEQLCAIVRAALPPDHAAWLERLALTHREGDYLFVHAGIRPGVPLAGQSAADLRWIRAPFLDHAGRHGAVIVHGHSIAAEPVLRDNRIGIDTGAYATGRLTALGLEGAERWTLATGGDQ